MNDADGNAFVDRTYRSEDGLSLHLRDYDPGPRAASRLPVICLPGLTRNSRDFHQLAVILSQDDTAPRRVISLDYRGRGLSDWDEKTENYNVRTEAQDVLAACDYFGIEKAVFVGTSRGGLILHFLAEMRPELLAAAILNDIGPEIEAKGLMRIRDDLNDGTSPQNRAEAVAMLKRRHGAHFSVLGDQDWEDMAAAIYREVDGRLAADADPAIAKQLTSIDFSKPLPTLWRHFEAFGERPLMVIRGENSELLAEAAAAEMTMRHPGLRVVVAPGQGHPPLLHSEPALSCIRQLLNEI
ncbi:alpha/beta hydrolase [Rhizobium sp. S96]|uniref:alpha/beta fold hydrolase n=1 Tax=Rhizobium sp. S96 TaxID=3055140 RepID=UPI0025AA6CDF|nr:alpha/beta hydrolase [Rhizobium sp. S96]MDM9619976.1 alpha/beta hydrolase [Rhizobium sp. S96]